MPKTVPVADGTGFSLRIIIDRAHRLSLSAP
jgi:hypothetical protein